MILLSQRRKKHIHIYIVFYSGVSILFCMFPYFFHWMSQWMSLPATFFSNVLPLGRNAGGGSEFPDGRCLDTHAEPRWSSDLGSVQCGDQAPRRCKCREGGQGKKGTPKRGNIYMLGHGFHLRSFCYFLLWVIGIYIYWNILEYIWIWVTCDGIYIELDGLLWYKNWDIYGGRVRYWWDMNGRAYCVCCFFCKLAIYPKPWQCEWEKQMINHGILGYHIFVGQTQLD